MISGSDLNHAERIDREAALQARADRRDRAARLIVRTAKIIAGPIIVLVLLGAMLVGTFGGRK